MDTSCDEGKSEILIHVKKESSLVYSPKRTGILFETKLSSETPEKSTESLIIKKEDEEFELLQRHINFVELFDGVCCSLRLLSLSKKAPTFRNMRPQVEILTGRSFSYGHLAKLKYLLPEALQIQRILVHDKRTLCMKPDMKIVLLFDVIKGHQEQSDYIALHQLFSSRLVNYFTAHPEACDIPEAMLPDPFNKRKESSLSYKVDDILGMVSTELLSQHSQSITVSGACVEDLPITTESEVLSKSLYMLPSFSRHFSGKVVGESKTKLLACSAPLPSLISTNLKNEDSAFEKTDDSSNTNSKFDSGTNLQAVSGHVKEFPGIISKSTSIDHLPVEPAGPESFVSSNACVSPLCKPGSSADILTVETPAQPTPRRVIPGSDDCHKSIAGQKQLSSSNAAKRSLDFSFLESNESERSEVIPDISQPGDYSSVVIKEEDKVCGRGAEEHRIYQSDITDEQISNSLIGLVAVIHHVFHSINYTSITKEELVHKIIINSFDFDERTQVEEHIEILEKRVPDWICKKLAPSGDALYSIKKVPDLETVKSRFMSV